jgi:hypothetical protein
MMFTRERPWDGKHISENRELEGDASLNSEGFKLSLTFKD